jgi:hypothetical protein
VGSMSLFVVTAIVKSPIKKGNDGKITAVLGNRTTAVHVPLEDGILVRIQVPQLNPLEIAGFCFNRMDAYWKL